MKKIKSKSVVVLILLGILSIESFSQTLNFEGINEATALKRGKEYSIKWSGGSKDQLIKIELHNLTGKVQSWEEKQNSGEQKVKLNSKIKPGKNYSFKIVTGSGEEVSSQNVQIKRKIPLALKISAIVIVPVAIAVIVSTSNNRPAPIGTLATPN